MGDPPYALTPVEWEAWAGAKKEDETMWKSKKQLLPKDLAARAEKLDPAKVEAEVLRVLAAKRPTPAPLLPWDQLGQIFQPGQMIPAGDLLRQEMNRQARQLEQLYMSDVRQTPFMPPSLKAG